MDEFLSKYCYLAVDARSRIFYFTYALITSITDTHISFEDWNKNGEIHTFRKIDIIEIKLSNRRPPE